MSAAAPQTRARVRILDHLAAHPGLTAQQVGRALGLRSNAMRTLRAMEYDAQVTADREWRPQMGRNVSVWRVAPPGTVPPPRPDPEPGVLGRRELRARARASAPSPFSSLQGAPVRTPRLTDPACRTADPALFFPPDEYEEPRVRRRRVRLAAEVCSGCPVRAACYRAAAERLEPWGVWGGVEFTPIAGGRRKAS